MPFMRALLVSAANRVDHPTTSRARTRAHNDDRRVLPASAERHIGVGFDIGDLTARVLPIALLQVEGYDRRRYREADQRELPPQQ